MSRIELDQEHGAWVERQALLQAARDHLATLPAGATVTPAELQRAIRCSWNVACSALEALEKDGELVRASYGNAYLAWTKAPAPPPPGRGYALPLSQKEHGALMRLLDGFLGMEPIRKDDLPTLRAIRSRLKRPA